MFTIDSRPPPPHGSRRGEGGEGGIRSPINFLTEILCDPASRRSPPASGGNSRNAAAFSPSPRHKLLCRSLLIRELIRRGRDSPPSSLRSSPLGFRPLAVRRSSDLPPQIWGNFSPNAPLGSNPYFRFVAITPDPAGGVSNKLGEGGIRTLEPLRVTGFRNRRTRPLCDLSKRLLFVWLAPPTGDHPKGGTRPLRDLSVEYNVCPYSSEVLR